MSAQRLQPVSELAEILPKYRDTPVAELLSFHNLGVRTRKYQAPELLICTCMDFRIELTIPEKYAFTIRTPGANLIDSEFGLAAVVGLWGIRAVAIVGHTRCAMTTIKADSVRFIDGFCSIGWSAEDAEVLYNRCVSSHALDDPAGFVVEQCQRLRKRYSKMLFAPLIYDVDDGKLYQVIE